MEYVPGGSIASMLAQFGVFTEELIKRFIRQVRAEASHGEYQIHRREIVWRIPRSVGICNTNSNTWREDLTSLSEEDEEVHPTGTRQTSISTLMTTILHKHGGTVSNSDLHIHLHRSCWASSTCTSKASCTGTSRAPTCWSPTTASPSSPTSAAPSRSVLVSHRLMMRV